MVYITGDIHGDIERFKDAPVKKLKKGDYLIVCGDFGFIWDNSKEELKMRNKIASKKYCTLFVPGINENYEILDSFPDSDFAGGKAKNIGKNLYMLENGECYTLCGKRFLAIGGGDESEYIDDKPSMSYLTNDEMEKALGFARDGIDYIISHDAPNSVKQFLEIGDFSFGSVCEFLDRILNSAKYEKWFFGKYHLDKKVSYKMTATYNNVIPLADTVVPKKTKNKQKAILSE